MLPDSDPVEIGNSQDKWEIFLFKYRYPLIFFFLGAFLLGLGVFLVKEAGF